MKMNKFLGSSYGLNLLYNNSYNLNTENTDFIKIFNPIKSNQDINANINIDTIDNSLRKKELAKQSRLLRNSDKMLVIDLETSGSISDPSTFAITEIGGAFVNNNGEILKENDTLMNFNHEFGINDETTYKEVSKLYEAKRRGEKLTKEQTESLKVWNARMKYNIKAGFGNNGKSDPLPSINNFKAALENMKTLGLNEKNSFMGSIYTFEFAKDLHNKIEYAIENDIPIVGHNIKQADLPWLNYFFKQYKGLSEIDFNKGVLIDTYELVRDSMSDVLPRLYKNADINISSGLMRLENLATLTRTEQGKHKAYADAISNIQIFTNNVIGTDETLLDIIDNNTRLPKGITYGELKDSNHLFSIRALPKGDNILDYFMENTNNKIEGYRSYIDNANMFFGIDSLTFTDASKLPEELRERYNNGVYTLKLSTVGDIANPYTVSINRGSIDEISDVIGSYFGVVSNENVPIEDMVKQNLFQEADTARRKVESFFSGDINSYKNAKKNYDLYNTVQENFKSTFNDDFEKAFTKENVQKLIKDKILEINGNIIDYETAFGITKENNVTPETIRDFGNMFNTLQDTNEIVSPILKEIDTSFTNVFNENNKQGKKLAIGYKDSIIAQHKALIQKQIKELGLTEEQIKNIDIDSIAEKSAGNSMNSLIESRKSAVLKNVFEQINSDLIENSDVANSLHAIKNEGNAPYSERNYVHFTINDNDVSVNVSNETNTKRSLWNIVRKETKLNSNEFNAQEERRVIINNLAKQAYENRYIEDNVYKNIQSNSQPKIMIDTLSSALSNVKDMGNEKMPLFIDRFGIETEDGIISATDVIKNNYPKALNNKYKTVTEYDVQNEINKLVNDEIKEQFNIINETISTNKEGMISKFLPGSNGEYTKRYEHLVNVLRENLSDLNYNDDEIISVADRIAGQSSSFTSNGFAVQIIKYKDKNGEIQKGIAAFKPENTETVQRAFANDEISDKVLIQQLPKKEKTLNGKVEYIKQGNSARVNNKNFGYYIHSDGHIQYTYTDTISDSINNGRKVYKKINELIDEGKYAEAQRILDNQTRNTPLSESSSLSLFLGVKNGKGRIVKTFIPNVKDITTARSTSVEGILPIIAWMNSATGSNANDIQFSNILDRNFNDDTRKKIDRILNNIYNKNRVYSMEEITSISPEFAEFLTVNLNEGELFKSAVKNADGTTEEVGMNLLQRVLYNNEKIKKDVPNSDFIIPENIAEELKRLSEKRNSTVGTRTQTKQMRILDTPAFEYTTSGTNISPRREQINNNLSAVPLVNYEIVENAQENGINNIADYFEKKFHGNGMPTRIANPIMTEKYLEDYMLPLTEEINNGVAKGVTTQMLTTVAIRTQEEISDAVKDLNPIEIMKEYNEYAESVNAEPITENQVKNAINQYIFKGTTTEQHSIVAPSYRKYFDFKNEVKTIDFDEDLLKNININDTVNSNTIIGKTYEDGKIIDRYYKGPEGYITDINKYNGKVTIMPTKPDFELRKMAIATTEKTMVESIDTFNGVKNTEFADWFFHKIFGDETMLVGDFEVEKHSSLNLPFGTVKNIYLEKLLEQDDSETVDFFVNLFNENIKDESVKLVDVDTEFLKKVFVTNPNTIPTNGFEDIRRLKEALAKNQESQNKNIAEISKGILDQIKYYENNKLYYVSASKLPAIETLNSSVRGMGMIFNERMNNIFAAFPSPLLYTESPEGDKVVSLMKRTKENFLQAIENSKGYSDKQISLRNILNANFLMSGYETEESLNKTGTLVRHININDVGFIGKSIDFSKENFKLSQIGRMIDEGVSVLAVDTNDIKYVNPYKLRQNIEQAIQKEGKEITVETVLKNPTRYNYIYDKALNEAMTGTIYIPLAQPIVVDDKQLYYGEYLNNIKKVVSSMQNDVKNAEIDYSKTNKIIEDFYGSLPEEFAKKDGLLNELKRGRVDNSTSVVSTSIIGAEITPDNQIKESILNNEILKKNANGKYVSTNVTYASKEDFNKLISDRNLVKQILNTNEIKPIEDELYDKGYIRLNENNEYELNLQSKEEFMKKNDLEFITVDDLDVKKEELEKLKTDLSKLEEEYETEAKQYKKQLLYFDDKYKEYKKERFATREKLLSAGDFAKQNGFNDMKARKFKDAYNEYKDDFFGRGRNVVIFQNKYDYFEENGYNDFKYKTRNKLKKIKHDRKVLEKNISSKQKEIEFLTKNAESINASINRRYKRAMKEERAFYEKQIASKYLSKVGIPGYASRQPNFGPKSLLATRIVFLDDINQGHVTFNDFIADMLHDDNDGDRPLLIFGKKGTNGKYEILRNDSEDFKEWELLKNYQENVSEAYYEKKMADGTSSNWITIDELEESFKSKNEKINTNFASDTLARQLGVKQRIDMFTIGHISETNKMLNVVNNANIYNKSNYMYATSFEEGLKINNGVTNFLALAEQKLIDTKHVKDFRKTVAERYSDLFNKLLSNKEKDIQNFNDNFKELIELVTTPEYSNMYKTNPLEFSYGKNIENITLTTDAIINGSYVDTLSNYREAIINSLSHKEAIQLDEQIQSINDIYSLYKVVNTQEARDIASDVMQKMAPYQDKINTSLKIQEAIINNEPISKSSSAAGSIKKATQAIDDNNDVFFKKDMLFMNKEDGKIYSLNELQRKKDGTFFVNLTSLEDTDSKAYDSPTKSNARMLIEHDFSPVKDLSKEEKLKLYKGIKNRNTEYIIRNIDYPDDYIDDSTKAAYSRVKNIIHNDKLEEYIDNKNFIADLKDANVYEFAIKYGNNGNTIDKAKFNIFKELKRNIIENNQGKENAGELKKKQIAEALKRTNSYVDNEYNNLTKQMNDNITKKARARRIKKRFNDTKGIARDIFNQMQDIKIEENIENNIDDIVNPLKEKINKISNRKIYNINEVNKVLQDKTKNVFEKLSEIGLNENFSDIQVALMKNNENFLKGIKLENIENIESIINDYNDLYKSSNKEAFLKAMGWTGDTLEELENAKITFGKFVNYDIKNVSVEDLQKILKDTTKYNESAQELINENKYAISKYIKLANQQDPSAINATRKETLRSLNTKQIKDDLFIDVNELNDRLIKKAEEHIKEKSEKQAQKTGEKIANSEKSKNIIKNFSKKKLEGSSNKNLYIGAALGGAVLLGALYSSGNKTISSGTIQDNNETKEATMNDNKPQVYQAPPTISGPRAMLQGIKLKITGDSDNSRHMNDILTNVQDSVEKTTGTQMNVNTTQKDNRSQIQDTWLRQKFLELIN